MVLFHSICMNAPATAEMYKINNPAANIYNPASRMDNPEPLSPPTQIVPPAVVVQVKPAPIPAKPDTDQRVARPVIALKSYNFKTAKEYTNAAKKAFAKDNYREFLSITEDALKRINAGTVKATRETRQKLINYKTFGYGLLEVSK